jgi:hypothetical protein
LLASTRYLEAQSRASSIGWTRETGKGAQMPNPADPAIAAQTEGDPGFSLQDITGRYTYKFAGFTMVNNILYRLLGLGQFTIASDGTLSGAQRSSITPLQGQGAKLKKGAYDVEGQITLDASGIGSAAIYFRNQNPQRPDLKGEFYLGIAGTGDRLWLISSGATLQPSNLPVDELVTLEAVRVRPLG